MFSLIFDLDDTLYFQKDQFEATVKKTNFFQNLEKMDELYKEFQKASEYFYKIQDLGEMTLEDMRIKRVQKAYETCDIFLSDKEALYWQETYHYEQQHISLKPIVEDILNFCQSQEIQLGLITNGPSDHQRMKISSLGLEKWFDEDHILVSGDINISKPDSRIFNTLADKLPKKTANYYYIGDNFENDVKGALAVDWSPIWLNTKFTKKINDSRIKVVKNHEELFKEIKHLIKISTTS